MGPAVNVVDEVRDRPDPPILRSEAICEVINAYKSICIQYVRL